MRHLPIALRLSGRVGTFAHPLCPRLLVLLCGSVGLLLLLLYRMRQRDAALAMHLERLMLSRTRHARDLQDSLLQTIEASKLIADDALDQPRDTARMLDAMSRLSGWMGQATTEAQAALHSLRLAEGEASITTQPHAWFLWRVLAFLRAWFATRWP